jgi:anti-sigma regulatory factor (Ser/Thr protein kinase)
MAGSIQEKFVDRLSLRGRLSEIAQVPAWIENLASRYSIPVEIQLGINLCLEEVVSNVMRHGYGNDADRTVVVNFAVPRDGFFLFVVEDEAPRYNPLDAAELPALNSSDDARIGGQGIRFLRRFASTLEYEPMPNGNRLSMGFSAEGPATRMP